MGKGVGFCEFLLSLKNPSELQSARRSGLLCHQLILYGEETSIRMKNATPFIPRGFTGKVTEK
jgi:hypothetical protein